MLKSRLNVDYVYVCTPIEASETDALTHPHTARKMGDAKTSVSTYSSRPMLAQHEAHHQARNTSWMRASVQSITALLHRESHPLRDATEMLLQKRKQWGCIGATT